MKNISVHTRDQNSNIRPGFDLLSFMLFNIHLVTILRLEVVFCYSCKLVNGQRLGLI